MQRENCGESKLTQRMCYGQHNEDMDMEKDNEGTKWLEKEGYHVIRFWNNDVLTNTEGVVYRIREALE